MKFVAIGRVCLLTYLLVTLAFAQVICAFAQDLSLSNETKLPDNAIWLNNLEVYWISQSIDNPKPCRSLDSNPITLKGRVYGHGVGVHANSRFVIDLKGAAEKFVSTVGVDDESQALGSVTFEVWVDGKKLADSGVLHWNDQPRLISADLTGARVLDLRVTDAGDGIDRDHADWADAMIVLKKGADQRPESMRLPKGSPVQIATTDFKKLGIHGPRIVGATPGRPFLFLIPATGEGPLTFSATNLPAGLTLDSKTGVISGSLRKHGDTIAEITVSNAAESVSRKLKIVGGKDKLALTPPMGWNSWNVWHGAVDDARVRAAADSMLKYGLASYGYQYVNIDDCWEGKRDASGEITTNINFPDMKALADYIHSKGLKFGIYSSPGPLTCAGFEGSYQHEQQDAGTYAKWGVDYLKYDWCSYYDIEKDENNREKLMKPYQVMHQALENCGRDIVYSLCQYGMGNVWEWGTQVGGNCWRISGDIGDRWESLRGNAFEREGIDKYAGPGHWNDPDMLVVGKLGYPQLHSSNLSPNEQIFHITFWSLAASPLLIGCDMTDMDAFTVNLLTNDEVLDVNQDPLGKPASRRSKLGDSEVWARPLWDDTIAVGLINRAPWAVEITAKWSDLGIAGTQPIRDLWQKQDLGSFTDSFTAPVPAHGAVLIKVGKPSRTDW